MFHSKVIRKTVYKQRMKRIEILECKKNSLFYNLEGLKKDNQATAGVNSVRRTPRGSRTGEATFFSQLPQNKGDFAEEVEAAKFESQVQGTLNGHPQTQALEATRSTRLAQEKQSKFMLSSPGKDPPRNLFNPVQETAIKTQTNESDEVDEPEPQISSKYQNFHHLLKPHSSKLGKPNNPEIEKNSAISNKKVYFLAYDPSFLHLIFLLLATRTIITITNLASHP